MDISKVLIASAAGAMAGSLAVGAAVIGSFAIGPLVVAVGVGILVGWALDKIDEQFHLTERLSRAIDEGLSKLDKLRRAAEHELAQEAHDLWIQIERARQLLDLSREADEILRRIGSPSLVRWRASQP